MQRSSLALLSIGAALAVATATGPARADEAAHRHRISPAVARWFDHAGYRAFQGRRMPNGPDPSRVPVTVRTASEADIAKLIALEGADLRLVRNGRRLSRLGPIVSAVATRAGIAQLAAEPAVVRVELDVVPPFDPPLDATVQEIGATDAWLTRDLSERAVTGQGVVVADLDSGIDVFHPMLFRGTTTYLAWRDANDNGAFDPGVDVVVLPDGEQPLDYFEGVAFSLAGGFQPILGTDDGVFDAGMDHLYVDANGNGRRDYGPADGFTEADATYGELLLLADDVDGNGSLDVGEKLVALGPSKIRAFYDGATEYRRDVDLIGAPGHTDPWAFHGTGVAGILAGGNRGLTALVGVAPDVDILLGAFSSAASLSPLLTWAVQNDADVILHEYAPWVGYHRDGSSNHELMMDEAAAAGAANVNPSGNLGGSRKHARADVPPQGAVSIPILAPLPDYTYVQITVHWRQPDRELELVLEDPNGSIASLGTSGSSLSLGDVDVASYRDDSSRGTAMFDIVMFPNGVGSVPTGTWQLHVTDVGATAPDAPNAELSLYVADDASGWGLGVQFPELTSEQHLIGFPSTADSAITVAAYTGRGEAPYNFGDEPGGGLRRYSCRGTRIDDADIMDIAAPDNPLSTSNAGGAAYPPGSYRVFGGTSGAGPHVAGTAALYKQLHPNATGAEVRDAIRAGALVDDDVHGEGGLQVQQLWGAGKLRTYRTLYGADPSPNTPPRIEAAPLALLAGEQAQLIVQVEDDEDAIGELSVEVDLDYDGSYDLGPTDPATPVPVSFDQPGRRWVKARVTDSGGLTGAILVRIDVTECIDCDPDEDPGDGASGCGCAAASPRARDHAILASLLVAFGLLLAGRRSKR